MSSAEKVVAGLKAKRPSLPLYKEPDDFERIAREVDNGKPTTSLARLLIEQEKARREEAATDAD